MYYDMTYILVIIAAIISMIASARVKSTYAKYARVASASGVTGAETAKRILQQNGIYDVTIQHVAGSLTDHYDPRTKTVNLSDDVYASSSVAALGVAAHECGHVIQHHVGYVPLSIRTAIVPVASFGGAAAWPIIVAGLFLGLPFLVEIGVFVYVGVVLFQLVTLPVEFDASRRALIELNGQGILAPQEVALSKKVLSAAAMTYVASAAAAILQLLRLILIANRRRR
ncbi:MAG: zinc metallopeptidase [Lachnospiraceae bacterium]|nr:zinc metallopeptidase [Lachnospiraceae bacterium]